MVRGGGYRGGGSGLPPLPSPVIAVGGWSMLQLRNVGMIKPHRDDLISSVVNIAIEIYTCITILFVLIETLIDTFCPNLNSKSTI